MWDTEEKHTSILSAEDVEGEEHGVGEGGGLLLAGEVEAIDLPGVPPLVEGRSGLVVLEALHYGVVDNHLWETREEKTERWFTERKQMCCCRVSIVFLWGMIRIHKTAGGEIKHAIAVLIMSQAEKDL